MKRYILITLLSIFALSASAQTHTYWYNPFGFQPMWLTYTTSDPELLAKDTSGQIWFASYDGVNGYMHVIDQSGTINDSYNWDNNSAETLQFYIGGRNTKWFWTDIYLFKDSAHTLSYCDLPHYRNSLRGTIAPDRYSPIGISSDRSGNDYFTVYYHNYVDSTAADSFFVVKYDGSTFQTIRADTLSRFVNSSSYQGDVAIPDSSGAMLINYKHDRFLRYYQGQWSTLPIVLDSDAAYLLTDKSDNHFFLSKHSPYNLYKLHGSSIDTIAAPPHTFLNYGNWPSISFTKGPDGQLWLITDNTGIYDLDSGNVWRYVPSPGFVFNYSPGVVTEHFFPCYFDTVGRLWITGGINNPPYFIGVYSFTPFNSISGRVFYDTNGNGIADSTERAFSAVNIVQSTNGFYSNTDMLGDYSVVYLDSTIAHTVSATTPPYHHLTTAGSYTVGPHDSLCCYNFGIVADGLIQDLQVSVASFCAMRGYPSLTWLSYQNRGTISVDDTITYTYDPAQHYVSAWPQPTGISGRTLSWAYRSLQPFTDHTIGIEFLTDTSAHVGDTLRSVATIAPLATDSTPADNVSTHTQVVSSSYDPNLKTVSPTTWAAAGDELVYTIHFQNTGTAPAVNIVVLDSLDTNLDPASYRLLGSSSHVDAKLEGPGVLRFTFLHIMLPDSSSNPTLSEGFVQFAIKIAKPLRHPATSIPNLANIFFDFNPAIRTNTSTTTYRTSVGIWPVSDADGTALHIAPNPAMNEVTIRADRSAIGGTVLVYDATGRLLISKPVEKEESKLNIENLATGAYQIMIKDTKGGTQSGTLLKR